jgi:hypothetical protein
MAWLLRKRVKDENSKALVYGYSICRSGIIVSCESSHDLTMTWHACAWLEREGNTDLSFLLYYMETLSRCRPEQVNCVSCIEIQFLGLYFGRPQHACNTQSEESMLCVEEL